MPHHATAPTRAECAALDATDPLALMREHFDLPDGLIYLDGNSLGALPASTFSHLREVVQEQWGRGLIGSWEAAGWWDKPRELGDRLAPLIGAAPGEVVVGDSTSVNLFKVLVAALRLRPGRPVVVSEEANFPTDLYVLRSALDLVGGRTLRLVERGPAALAAALDEEVAVVLLTHVDYRSAAMFDLGAITGAVHDAGAIMIFDLCHSVGALPLAVSASGLDFAVGCTYKYLNGGPGSPAFVYAAHRHHEQLDQPLSGWGGHAFPFSFDANYLPAPGAARFSSGTPAILSLAGLEASLALFERVDLAALREKSVRQSEILIDLVDALGVPELELVTPREPACRGSHVAYRHPRARELRDELARRGVLGDFRPPELLRLGIAPLYVRYVDIFDAVAVLGELVGA